MASSLDFVIYICDQMSSAGIITYKKMFGEYGIYCNEKIVGLICNNQFFVKKTKAGAAMLPDCEQAAPYTGAKPHFLVECVENSEFMGEFIFATYHELPAPKPKKKKAERNRQKNEKEYI